MLSESSKNKLAVALLFISPLCFASNPVVGRAMMGIFPPVSMAVARWFFVALFLMAALWPQVRAHYRQILAEWKSLAFLGGLGMGLCGAPIYISATLTPITNIGLIYAVCPLVILLLGIGFFKIRMRVLPLIGVLAGLVGVVLILTKGDMGILASLSFNSGDLLVLQAMLAFAVYSLGLKHIPSKLPPILRFGAMALAGALWHLPFLVYEVLVAEKVLVVSSQIVGVVLILVFVSSLGAYLSYGYIVQRLGAAQAGTILYIQPIYSTLLAVWLFSETIASYHLIGIALILPGLWLANR